MEGRDEAEEAERHPSAGVVEFPGIVETDSASIRNPGNTGEWQAASSIGFASAQMPPRAHREQGLKILAREENYIAARHKLPNSQTEWLWDCLTPQVALAGIFVSAGAVVSSRRNPSPFDTQCRPPAKGINPSRCDGSRLVAPLHSGLRCPSSLNPSKRESGAPGGVGPKLAGTD